MAEQHAFRDDDIAAVITGPTGVSPVPVHLVPEGFDPATLDLDAGQCAWIAANGFAGAARKVLVIPADGGKIAAVLLGTGKAGAAGDPCGPAALLAGLLPPLLPSGTYAIARREDAMLGAIAWGLGAYKFSRYRAAATPATPPALAVPTADVGQVRSAIEAVWLGRDLVNTPANDMGPDELEAAARAVAARHDASCSVIAGDDLLAQNFPLIHAVGRASPRAPRLVDIHWGRPDARKLTIVGKGIVFDTGGLDIKPVAGMALMKKDMGGAATALAAAHMIMAAGADVRLRVLLPIAENAISGNAFRPGDVLKSRSGRTVEIGSTDAEGRLVLADALTLADEESPDALVTLATLTGAARVALGPDLPALYCDDEDLARAIMAAGEAIGDPAWRLPFWPGYERLFDSDVADMNNAGESPFAGSITAALFLRRYVQNARRFAHFDIYCWRPQPRPLGPKGGEVQMARTLARLAETGEIFAGGARP